MALEIDRGDHDEFTSATQDKPARPLGTAQGLREYGRVTGQEVVEETPEPTVRVPPGPPRREKAMPEPQPSSPA